MEPTPLAMIGHGVQARAYDQIRQGFLVTLTRGDLRDSRLFVGPRASQKCDSSIFALVLFDSQAGLLRTARPAARAQGAMNPSVSGYLVQTPGAPSQSIGAFWKPFLARFQKPQKPLAYPKSRFYRHSTLIQWVHLQRLC